MTRRCLLLLVSVLSLALQTGVALSESEMPAGGAFMSSYTSDPYFDPRSRYSQAHATGDIRGQPMLVEPGEAPPPCKLFDTACAATFERSRPHAYR